MYGGKGVYGTRVLPTLLKCMGGKVPFFPKYSPDIYLYTL